MRFRLAEPVDHGYASGVFIANVDVLIVITLKSETATAAVGFAVVVAPLLLHDGVISALRAPTVAQRSETLAAYTNGVRAAVVRRLDPVRSQLTVVTAERVMRS